ncbi:acetoacetate decarboxylase family protein [Nocardia goodfellowii]|uniref:Acetoacetate decarboxylase n=1 Tax=Nocardia goodfellowii TaxID=882446 RepID=A0ABS4QIP1_9NOCA|nr:acetoacetate decarboxylase family protein [Nocardia goodfellowii]MBP2191569.1 hypothetical protein [Nocardia goodfellowii]
MNLADLTAVLGVPETRLPGDFDDQLPASVPPAPWRTRCSALLWFCRAGAVTPMALRTTERVHPRPLLTMAGIIEYKESPVGGYREVLAASAFRHGRHFPFHCPFIAVDSLASMVAGRTNWSLPKVPAAFEGQPGQSGTMTCRSSSDVPWKVEATARGFGPAIPMAKNFTVGQTFPLEGFQIFPARLSGRARLAMVEVEVESPHLLGRLIRPGRHLGLLVETMSATLGVPGPAQ